MTDLSVFEMEEKEIEIENKVHKGWQEGVVYGASMVANSLDDGELKTIIKFYIEQGLKPWYLHCDPDTEPPVLTEWINFFIGVIQKEEA